jgi:serine/threonine protein kinase/TolB-like protein
MSELFEQIAKGIEGHYEIVRELGRGGMATVFLARDLRHDRFVALKVLRSSVADSDGVERFLAEIRITARLQHPHILTLLDSGEANGHCYYVTPYMEGDSLRQRLILDKQLPIEVAVQLVRQVATALDYAHRHGVVHRDIKPENILLTAGLHAVVSDFGVAQAIDAAGVSGVSSHGAIGTMAYMSPEQVMNTPDLDGRCDLYALGCMLFEMLAGRTPFIGISPQELADQQLNATPPAITSLRPMVPPELANILNRCLAKTPADRFSTGAELALALGAVSTMPTPTPPTGYSVWVPETDSAPWLRARGTTTGPALTRHFARFNHWAPKAALVVLALASGGYALWQRSRPPVVMEKSATSYGASLAVLPFDNLGGGQDVQVFADGITEEIISRLSALRGLKVISRTSTLALKQTTLTIPQIADTLKVRHILEGTVRRSGSKIRVTAQLIEAHTDTHLWTETFEHELKDVFLVQDEIAHQVSRLLSAAVQGLGSMADAPRPSSSGAYDAYLQGKFLLKQVTPEGVQSSIAALRRSIELDSMYAPAYAALAEAFADLGSLSELGTVDDYRLLALRRRLADKAIQLDPGLADAYAYRAESHMLAYTNVDSALADTRYALQLRPNAVNLHGHYAYGLAALKKYDEALEHAAKAVELDPVSPGARMLFSGVASAAGKWDLVLVHSRHARALAGPLMIPNAYEAAALLFTGRIAACLQQELGYWKPVQAACLYAMNRKAEAHAMLAAYEKEVEKAGVNWVNAMALAIAYGSIGNATQWARWFERGVDISSEVYFPLILDSDLHDPIRADPLFEATLARARETIRRRFAAEFARVTVADALR